MKIDQHEQQQPVKFQKYDSIENTYRTNHIEQCEISIALGRCEDDFVVEEKAHGANFAFYYDGSEMKTASRSGFLEKDGEDFCKSHIVKRKYAPMVQTVHEIMGEKQQQIRLVGELIGGSYHHPDVKMDRTVSRVQKGVEYCPGLEFYAYDLFIWDATKQDFVLLDKIKTNELFEKAGLLYARTLFRGTFKQCLDFNNTFKSNIPSWLGLPEHPLDNLAEGKVIKPIKYATLANGKRIILKDKTESFSEISKAPKPKEKKATALSDEANEMLSTIATYITVNRLRNVLSKLSTSSSIGQSDFGQLCGLLSKDVFEDFHKDHGEAFGALHKKQQKAVKGAVAGEIKMFMKAHMDAVVSGDL